jgi:hypothetical protein
MGGAAFPSPLGFVMTDNKQQLLHLVMGGRVSDPRTLHFQDLKAIEVVGIFPDYASALEAWRAASQRTVDDAEMKYVIVHLHKLLDPSIEGK